MVASGVGPPPRPPWRTADGELIDADELRGDDVEIDLTGEHPRIQRKQYYSSHPWADQWPTWTSL